MKSKITEIMGLLGEFVTSHEYERTPILTAYVDVDPTNPANQRERPAWQIDLKNEARRLEDELGSERLKRRQAQVRWDKAEEMLTTHLQARKPAGRTVALFTDLGDDFISFDVPVSMTTRLYYGMPQIKHLLFALDQYKKYLTVLVAGAEVRLAEVLLTRTTEEVTVKTEHEKLRRLGRKSMEAGQDRRSPEFERRFVSEVAADINAFFLQDPEVERLILSGNAQLAHAVNDALHPAVRQIVVALTPMDFKAPSAEIGKLVKRLAETYEQEHDLTVVADLSSLHKRGGAAALGQEAVQRALAQGLVKTLVLPYPIDAAQFDPLIVETTVKGVAIEFVSGAAAGELASAGGIGAFLYYTI